MNLVRALWKAALIAFIASSYVEGKKKVYLAQKERKGLTHRAPVPVPTTVQQFKPVPLFVMLPLDTVHEEGGKSFLREPEVLRRDLMRLQRAGVQGVMVDVWWGIVERDGPGKYDWSAYMELVKMVAELRMKLQAVMSFHQCGGNIGDACFIPLPKWVLEIGDFNPNIFYTDMSLNRNREYVSLGADEEKIFYGRSPLDMYEDFMHSFATTFAHFIPNVVIEAQIGLGPAGELRYPSYPLAFWNFPGVGQFQCYDKYMRRDLIRAAVRAKKPEWGLTWPPHADQVGNYNYSSEHTEFFKDDGLWQTEAGAFFLEWYSNSLLRHGDKVLARARRAFKSTNILLAAKVAGIHWGSKTKSHAPELTAGYFNTCKRDGYKPIAEMFAKHRVMFDFTCLEMKNEDLPDWARSAPVDLVEHTRRAADRAGCLYAGENALPRFDRQGFEQIIRQCAHRSGSIASFTYLRLGEHMMDSEHNWLEFVRFAKEMQIGCNIRTWNAPPRSRQSRRVVDTHVHIPESSLSSIFEFGGTQLYTPAGAPTKTSSPDALVTGDLPEPRVPRVRPGVQAGTTAGRNGVPNQGKQTIHMLPKVSTPVLTGERFVL